LDSAADESSESGLVFEVGDDGFDGRAPSSVALSVGGLSQSVPHCLAWVGLVWWQLFGGVFTGLGFDVAALVGRDQPVGPVR